MLVTMYDGMQIRDEFPHKIDYVDNAWIILKDGTRLAIRTWMPETATNGEAPVPAILEYIPYRKNDGTAWRDSLRHPWLAGHGYAMVRVDVRGNGDSDGLMPDEYLPQELADGVEVIAWLADQSWCDGNVGMFGKSWGGFNSLQIAALQPPALKAIITVASTDDRFADDVHYMGGGVLASEMLSWASTMLCYNATPPDPRNVGDKWREMWQHRLENTPPNVEEWLSHQRRDEFWQHGSVCENYADITCAVYAVGGWADGYTDPIPRMLEGLNCPRKGIIGPWAHNYPTNSQPKPSIGFMQESLRWWDHWLKGIDTGIMEEPMLRSWIQDSYQATTNLLVSEGRWIGETDWPAPTVSAETHTFIKSDDDRHHILGDPFTGMNTERWAAYGAPGDYASDQRGDDGRSLTYTTGMQSAHDIHGFPVVHLTLQVDQPQASVAARLCDVSPDGASTLVSWGVLNLSHRDSHTEPEVMSVGVSAEISIKLNVCGQRLAEGHRWRISLSPTYWPHIWPSPNPVTLTIEKCTLELPRRKPAACDETLHIFDSPEIARPLALEMLSEPTTKLDVHIQQATETLTITRAEDEGHIKFPDGLELADTMSDEYIMQRGNATQPTVICKRTRCIKHGDWDINIETQSTMTSDADNFYLTNSLKTYEGSDLFFEREWEKTIKRDHN